VTRSEVDAIGCIGPAASEALPVMEKMTRHPSELIRARAEIAIRRIHGENVTED
jgi:hypothetical protein